MFRIHNARSWFLRSATMDRRLVQVCPFGHVCGTAPEFDAVRRAAAARAAERIGHIRLRSSMIEPTHARHFSNAPSEKGAGCAMFNCNHFNRADSRRSGETPIASAVGVLLALTIAFAAQPPTAHAAPVWGDVFNLRQPDGDMVAVRIWGDEFYQIVESLDGYTLVRDGATEEICYADVSANGEDFISTGIVVGTQNPATLGLVPHLRINAGALRDEWMAGRSLFAVGEAQTAQGLGFGPGTPMPAPPSTGNVLGVTLVVDFSDQVGTVAISEIDNYLNQIGYVGNGNNGSVRDFFFDVSDGNLDYMNNVPVAYYRALNPKTYYDSNVAAGPKARELVLEALNALETSGHDFSQYDANGDGFIDAVNLFYAGTPTFGFAKGLWPHQWSLSPTFTADGKTATAYQITNIGTGLSLATFCHETGHLLFDWNDLYDVDGDSNGVGLYDLMGFTANSKNPQEPGAHLKELAGWANVTLLTTPASGLSLVHGTNTFFKYVNPDDSNEFFIIENRQKSDRDAAIPDAGIAVWHIDLNKSGNAQQQRTTAMHYESSLEQADGLFHLETTTSNYGDTGDLYHSGGVTTINSSTTPNSDWWDGAESNFAISNISTIGSTMTFDFDNGAGVGLDLSVDTISSQAAGVAFDVGISVLDTFGDAGVVSSDTRVTLTVKTGTGALGGSVFTTIASGSSSGTISGITYDTSENGVVLTATASGGDSLTADDSNAFNMAIGPPTTLRVDTVATQTAGSAFDVEVNVEDSLGNPAGVTAITLITLSRNAGTGSLSGTITGVLNTGESSVTISGVQYDTAETGVQLRAAASGPGGGSLSAAMTNLFNVTAGTGSELSVATIASPQVANAPFDVGVSVLDSQGNPTNVASNTTVTLSVAAGTGSLSGTVSGIIPSGSSSFTISGAKYSKIESNVRIRATAAGLTSSTSNLFDVGVGTASQMVISTIASQRAGIGFDVGISTKDAYGNTSAVTGDTAVSLTLAAGTGSLTGTTMGTLTNGSSAFTISGVTYDTVETGVVLNAAATGLGNTDSNAFNITAGIADRLAMATLPTQGLDVPFDVVVTATDSDGNPSAVLSNTTITLTKKTGSGTPGGNLSAVMSTGQGSVTISGVTWDTAETDVELTATASGGDTLTAVDSNMFDVEMRTATKLGIDTIANHAGGTPFSVTVNVLDASDLAAATSQNTTVVLSVKTGTGALFGTLTKTIAAGEQRVTFTGLDYNVAQAGVVLKATATTGDMLTAADSNAFTITAGPAQIISPANESTLTSTSVTFNWNTGANVTQYRLWVGTAPLVASTDANIYVSPPLTGTSQVVTGIPTNGGTVYVKLFSYINSVFQSTSYTYTAPTAGVATHLKVPTLNTQTAGTPFTVTVQAADALGTLSNVTQNTGVTISLKTGTGSLSGTLTGTITSGSNSVSITGVDYDKAEAGVVLTATRTAGDTLQTVDSNAFTVNGGVASKLSVATIANQGTDVGFDVVVSILDANDNPSVATQATTITLTKTTGNSATGTIAGVTTGVVDPGSGSVTITGVEWDADATGAEITATPTSGMTGLTPADSNTFDVATRTATKLLITTIANQGRDMPFDVIVTAADSSDNVATVSMATQVTLSLDVGTGTLGGVLTGTIANGASSVTISGVTYNKFENNIALDATPTTGMTGLTVATSNMFNVTTAKATLTNPAADGDTLTGATFTFQWTAGAGVTQYRLWVGSAPMTVAADADIYRSLALTGTSQQVTGLPTDGSSVYVRLLSYINGVFQQADYTFVAAQAGVATHIEVGAIGTQVAGTSFGVGVNTVDALGDPATVSQDTRVALSVQTGTGTLGGTTFGTIASGSSSFTVSGVTYDTAETGVVLRVTSVMGDTLVAANSAAFTVNGGVANKLSIATIANQGTDVGFDVVVSILDASDNPSVATQTTTITLTKKNGNSATGTIAGVTTGVVDPGSGSVTISGVEWDADATGAEITATPTSGMTGLTPADSNTFDVATRTPTKLAFSTIANQGTGLPFDVVVQALDSSDQPANVTMATQVTLSVNNGAGTLGGVINGTITNGTSTVTISGATYSVNGTGVTLDATPTTGMTSLTVGTSNAFNVGAKKAELTFPATNGATLGGATVTFQWNTGSGVTQYRLWVGSGPLTDATDADIYKSLALTGTSQQVTGIPTDGSNVFVRLLSYINGVFQQADYTFVAATAGVATHVQLGTIATQTAGATFSVGALSVDALGDPIAVTQDTRVALSVQTGTGTLGGTTYGTITSGSSAFTISGVTYSKAETGVVLRGTGVMGDMLAADDSNAFTVNGGVANKLSIATIANQGTSVGFDVVVSVLDSADNPSVATQSTTITLTKTTGNSATGTVSGVQTGVIDPGSGSVTISGVTWTLAATGAEITATPTSGMTSLTPADSNTFDVTTRTPTKLAISTIGNQGTGVPFDIVVRALDSSDQPANVTSSTQVTLSVNNGSGTLGGVFTGTIINGDNTVTISGATYSAMQNGVTLDASPTTGMTALTFATSNAFNVGAAKASMTTPVMNGDTLTGTTFTFVWNAGSGVTQYRLWVGSAPMTTVADANIHNSGPLTVTSRSVSGIPSDGSNVYVRLHSYINGAFQVNDYTYVAPTAGTATHLQVVTIANQTAGASFDVGIRAVDALGDPATVSQDTGIALSVQTGSGSIGGTTAGTITSGTSSFTISGVTYDVAETGVKLRATTVAGDTLIAANSTAFTVTGGPATKLSIATVADQGTNIAFGVTVNVLDANDNASVATQATTVTLTKKSGSAATGTISGVMTGVIQAGSGSVTITGVEWTAASTNVELTATPTSGQTGLTVADSNMFDVSTRTATKLVVDAIGNQGKDQPFNVTVRVLDASDAAANVSQLTTITLTRQTGTGTLGGVLTGTIPANSGTVTISGATYNKIETGVVLTASTTAGDSLTAANSAAFNVGNAPAVMTNPAQDGDTLTGASVTFTWSAGFGVAQYRLWVGTGPMTTVADADIYSSLALTGTSKTVGGLPMDGSDVYVRLFSFIDGAFQTRDYTYSAASAGQATQLTIGTVAAQEAGEPFSVSVQAIDSFGTTSNVATDTGVSISVAVGTGSVGGTFTGTIVGGASAVTISGVTYDTKENGVVLRANRVVGDLLSAGTSNAFNVAAGPPAAMAFQTIAAQGAGDSFGVTVEVHDQFGNVTNATQDTLITITKSPMTSATGTLAASQAGTVTMGANNVTISGLSWDTVETDVQLRATASGGDTLTVADSATFDVGVGGPSALAVATIADQNTGMSFAVRINVEDSLGNPTTATEDTTITLTKQAGNSATGTLGGTRVGTLVGGAAGVTISGLTWDAVDTGVVLTATASNGDTVTAGDSNSFTVAIGTPVDFTVGNVTGVRAGETFNVVVTARDQFGNAAGVSSDTGVALTLKNGTGSLGGITAGTIPMGASTFTISGATYSKLENNVRLTVTTSGGDNLGGPTDTNFFNVAAGTAASISFQTVSAKQAGEAFSLVVIPKDQFGNTTTVTADTRVSLSKKAGSAASGTLGTTLTGSLTGTISAGTNTKTMPNLTWSSISTGAVVTATRLSGDMLTAGDTNAFNVTPGPASQLAMTVGTQAAGEAFAVTVTAKDSVGSTSTVTQNTVVTLSKTSGSSASGTLVPGAGGLSGTILAGQSSVAISGLKWNVMETGVQLTATRSSGDTLAAGMSNTFTVSEGPPAKVAFATVAGQTAGTGFDVGVIGQDQFGNTSALLVDTKITITRATGTGTVSGTRTGTFGVGQTTFTISGVNYDVAESGVSLRATASLGFPLTAGTSNTFTVSPGVVSAMSVDTVTTQAAGIPFDVVIRATDAFGNETNVTQATTVQLSRNTGTGNLTGTVSGVISNGTSSVTISGVRYDKAESGVVLNATRTGGHPFTTVTSNAFTCTGGTATALTVATIPDRGVNLGFDVVVSALDAFGNPATVVTDTGIALTKKTGIGATGTVSGNLTGTIVGGANAVTISGVIWDTVETGVQLTATRTAGDTLTAADSNAFQVVVRPPTQLGFAPITTQAVNNAYDVVVEIQDMNGDPTEATLDTRVTISVQSGTGALGGVLTATIASGSSSFTFSNLTYNKIENNVVLRATRNTGNVLTAGNSSPFNVAAGVKAVMTSPTNGATLSGASETFAWSTGINITQYRLWVGSQPLDTADDADIYRSTALAGTSQLVTGIPTTGGTIYVRLFSYINGVFETNDYTYTASGTPPSDPPPAPTAPVAIVDNEPADNNADSNDEAPAITPDQLLGALTGGGLCGMGGAMSLALCAMSICGMTLRRRRTKRSRINRRRYRS